ncbi:MAG TPA: carbohydrate porin [Stellaceae bacterium]|nr:carbohydrate porin [Stellaceae bacterium]
MAQTVQPDSESPAAAAPLPLRANTTQTFARANWSQFNFNPGKPKGPLASVGKSLQDLGINVRIPVWWQFMDNVTEGAAGAHGRMGSGTWFLPVIDFDLDKMFGLKDTRIRTMEEIHVLKLHGGGGADGFQSAAASGPFGTQHRLLKEPNTFTQLSIDHLMFDKRLDVEVGRMNAKRYFFGGYCDVNLLSCNNLVLERNAGLPPSAFSTWMGRAAWNFTPHLYVQGAIEELDPHANSTRGFDFGTNHANATGGGFISLGEIAYKTNFRSTAYPLEIEAGGWKNTASHADPLNSKLFTKGTSAFQLDINKTVWRQDGGASRDPLVRHLNVYTQFGKAMDPTSVYDTQVAVGTSLYAPFASRPHDIVGAKVTYLRLTSHERGFLQASQFGAGGANEFHAVSTYFELNYHIQLYPDVVLEPVAQYVLHPDTLFNAKVKSVQSGWVLGFTLVMDISRLAGLGG